MQGNEFSYYMLLTSAFVLNHMAVRNEWTIYPWVHSNCNQLCDADQLRPVRIDTLLVCVRACGHVCMGVCVRAQVRAGVSRLVPPRMCCDEGAWCHASSKS